MSNMQQKHHNWWNHHNDALAVNMVNLQQEEEEIGLEEEGDTMVEIVAGIDLIGHGGLKETACTIARID